MLAVGGRPLLETLVRQLVKAGATRIFLVVRYLREQIEDHFGDGSRFGVEIHYLREPEPYGTAGGLSLIPTEMRPSEPFLVVNGDLLTPLDFKAFYVYALGYTATLVRRQISHRLAYGYPVLGTRGRVIAFDEKPTLIYHVNSGIYGLTPALLDGWSGPRDMPDLIRAAIGAGQVAVYTLFVPFHEIGTPESYAAAEAFYQEHMRSAF